MDITILCPNNIKMPNYHTMIIICVKKLMFLDKNGYKVYNAKRGA